jgi:phosphate-selective porin OprO/OprP
MKKAIVSVFLSVYLISLPYASYAAESEVDLLVEMLVDNGTLTQEQAQKLAQEAKRLKEAKERARQEEREEIITICIQQVDHTIQPHKEAEDMLSTSLEQLEQKMRTHKEAEEMLSASIEQLEQKMRTYKEAEEINSTSIEQTQQQAITMDASWKDGLRFKSRDGNFETKIGGRIFADLVNTSADGELPESIRPQGDFNNRNDEAYIRSARLNIEGTMYEDYFYNFEYEFEGDINTKTEVDGLRDMYMGMKGIPFMGRVSVGHMKEPFSLEESTSSSDTTFIERSLANVFAPGYSWGVASQNAFLDDRVTLGVGTFVDSDSSGTTSYGNAFGITTRVTGLPWYGGEDKLLHTGTSYTLRNPKEGGFNGNPDDTVRFRQRPDMYTRDYLVDTDDLYIDQDNRLGFETAFMYGPFSVQGELIQTWLEPADASSHDSAHLYGGYGSVSYILTGEHRIYDKNDGRFQGVIPNKNFSLKNFSLKDRTWGAWEIAARWSYLSLEDKDMDIEAGEADAATVGLNWYLNPNMRLMLNWVHSKLKDTDGSIDGIQLRAQVDF